MSEFKLNPCGVMATIRELYGPAADSDGYKGSHIPMYPKGAKRMVSYIESRGGKFNKVVWFGLQLLIKEHFSQQLTHTHVDNIIAFEKDYAGGNVTEDLEIALRKVVDEYNGWMPIRIRSAKEGMIIPVGNVLVSVESTVDDTDVFALVSYFETKLLRVWSPTTVATISYNIRQVIEAGLKRTTPKWAEAIDYMLVDFGSRGTPADAAAAFAGSGHLVSFKVSDTKLAVLATNIAYNAQMSAYTIPASEHSVTTAHGPNGEKILVKNVFDAYAKPNATFATVIDSFNWKNFIFNIAPEFKERLIQSGSTWIFRPDSGHAVKTPVQVVKDLGKVFGYTRNEYGFKVLNNVKCLQGDGIGPEEVSEIIEALIADEWCITNMVFGMGAGLLQKNDRDTQKFAMKCCAVLVGDEWVDVYKDPAVFDEDTWELLDVESFKKSKQGRLELIHNAQTDGWDTVRTEDLEKYVGKFGWETALDLVWDTGVCHRDMTLDDVRANAGIAA